MKTFVHPHVMGILGICLAGQAPYIVMPFMANGSLHSYLRKHRAELLLSEDEDIDLVKINSFANYFPKDINFGGFSVGSCINEEEGYRLLTSAQRNLS